MTAKARASVVFVLALLATAVTTGCGGSGYPDTPEAVVERFEQAWNTWSDRDPDPGAVCEVLTEDAIAADPATGRTDCAATIGRFWRTEGTSGSDISLDVGEIVDQEVSEGRATIETDKGLTFTLAERDARWKLTAWPSATPGSVTG